MIVFLDFEASSLADDSYPIEVAWVFETGDGEAHLIRPALGWTDWDAKAERIHKLSRAQLEAEGEDHQAVAARMIEALSGHKLFASAPSWDGKWLSLLLRSSGFARHALRLQDTDVALEQVVAEAFADTVSPGALHAQTARILKTVERERAAQTVSHRALDDARRELWTWRRSQELASADSKSVLNNGQSRKG